MSNLLLVLNSVLILLAYVCCSDPTVRQTLNGPVEGVEQISSLGQNFYAFKGVPYAESPITGDDPHNNGERVDRRFKAPEPIKRTWKKNLKVQNFGNVCTPSVNLFELNPESSEDCLYLNIYVPAGGAKTKTVLVWIHGGIFIGGEPTDTVYGPDFLMSADNILITVHYRLGIFGFLNLGFGEYTGNMGMKDQRLALKWIYENIENFSGNKEEILLFGCSAGASSVHFHVLNKESRKYFNRALICSGSVFSGFAFSKANHSMKLQQQANVKNEKDLIDYLKSVDTKTLVEYDLPLDIVLALASPWWGPVIENPNVEGAFITQKPNEMFRSGDIKPMDVLFTFTSKEFVTFNPVLGSQPLLKEVARETKLPLTFYDFDGDFTSNIYEKAVEALRKSYFFNTRTIDDIKQGNLAFLSDLYFAYGVLRGLDAQMELNNKSKIGHNSNIFLYRLSIDAGLNVFKIKYNMTYDGAGPVDDLCYIFHCHMLDEMKVYDEHLKAKDLSYEAIMRMVTIITNFAKTGNPSVEADTPFKACEISSGIFCQEITNNPVSSVTTNIMEQLHYKTWRNAEESYERLIT